MTTRLYAHASTAGTALCTIASFYATTLGVGWPALAGLYTAALLAWNARRCYAQARRERAIEQQLERLGREQAAVPELPPVCCSFWLHSDRQVHGPDCTRPPAARTTLTPAEEQAITQITRSFHRAGGEA